jgi:hypothetical protein
MANGKKKLNAYVIYPIKLLPAILYGAGLDDIQVYREVGMYDPKTKKFEGYVPLFSRQLQEYLFYKPTITTLSSLVYQASQIGIDTLIVIRKNREELERFLEKLAKKGHIYDIDTVLQKHNEFINTLTKYFRVIEIDEDIIKDYLADKIEEEDMKEKLQQAFDNDENPNVPKNPNVPNIDLLQEIVFELTKVELDFNKIRDVKIHSPYAVSLMVKSAEYINPVDYFIKRVAWLSLWLVVGVMAFTMFLPIAVAPLVSKYLPTPQPVQIQTINTPTLNDIKGMYLPPLPKKTGTVANTGQGK